MVYIGIITHLLTIDPNFQQDIQVGISFLLGASRHLPNQLSTRTAATWKHQKKVVKRTNHENLKGTTTCHVRGPKKAPKNKPYNGQTLELFNLYKWPSKLVTGAITPNNNRVVDLARKNQNQTLVSPIFRYKALLFGMNHLLVP